jgi:hypothetical protein
MKVPSNHGMKPTKAAPESRCGLRGLFRCSTGRTSLKYRPPLAQTEGFLASGGRTR